MAENLLIYGDNLDVLRRDYIDDESVDCIYLDPPFNSSATYNVLFRERDGSRAAAQIEAFGDTWQWDQAAVESFENVVERGGEPARAMLAFREFLGDSNMLAYLSMMAPRLIELHRVLVPTGNIFLHCDPTASHYLKMLMDAVFGAKQFRNEIVWCYRGGGVPKNAFARKHDIILFYAKSDDNFFEPQYEPYSEASQKLVEKRGGVSIDGKERDLERGKHMNDWWTDINSLQTWSPERLPYPTQKPEALLERIIKAGCPEGGTVLDPFCGCGTAVVAAHRLKRRWIGIDITHLAVNLMKYRLQDTFGEEVRDTYEVIGEPVSLPDAKQLAGEDPFQFQFWSLGLVGARPTEKKKGADQGIDGRIYFHDERQGGDTKQVIISVKAGKTGPDHVRELRGVIERENAQIGVLISMQEPTAKMRSEAASAGTYESPVGKWGKHPRIQLLTVEELLEGGRIDMPPAGTSVTFKKAQKDRPVAAETQETFRFDEDE